MPLPLDTIDLGLMPYAQALERQRAELERVLASRDTPEPILGRILLVEHPPVITISNRPGAATNLLASPELLASMGVTLEHTDRGGDIPYHGPGPLVAYPLLDLNRLALGLHEYMRLLEQAVIDTLASFGVQGRREPGSTGVWVKPSPSTHPDESMKIAAMGVRVRRWVSMHGLSLNIDPDMSHYALIVPCGLVGRPVTSLRQLLGDACPTMPQVRAALLHAMRKGITEALSAAHARRS